MHHAHSHHGHHHHRHHGHRHHLASMKSDHAAGTLHTLAGTLTKLVTNAIKGTEVRLNDAGHPVGTKPAHTFGGWCAHNVVTALNEAGIHVPRTHFAKDLPTHLQKTGFERMETCEKPLAGDVMVIGACPPRHDAGHVAIYTGKQTGWVSDATQGNNRFVLAGVTQGTQESRTAYFRNPSLAAQAEALHGTRLAASDTPTNGAGHHHHHHHASLRSTSLASAASTVAPTTQPAIAAPSIS